MTALNISATFATRALGDACKVEHFMRPPSQGKIGNLELDSPKPPRNVANGKDKLLSVQANSTMKFGSQENSGVNRGASDKVGRNDLRSTALRRANSSYFLEGNFGLRP